MICGSKTTARIDIEAMAAHDKSCVGVSQNGSGDVGMVRHVSSFPSPETGVSKNRGTPKWMVYNGKPYLNGCFGGTTIFGNIQTGFVMNVPFLGGLLSSTLRSLKWWVIHLLGSDVWGWNWKGKNTECLWKRKVLSWKLLKSRNATKEYAVAMISTSKWKQQKARK